jgi:hypothetical protein
MKPSHSLLVLGQRAMDTFEPDQSPNEVSSCRRNMNYNTGLERRVSLVPSPTPPRRKLMLDNCLSEYVEILRGAIS